MVKHWEKMGRNSRKPILQLDDNRTNTLQPSSSGSSANNLRGLIHYEDSDEDTTTPGEEESCVSSAGETSTCPKNGTKKLDLEVADFLKEIDAMTSNDAQDTSEAEAKDCDKNQVEEKEIDESTKIVNDQANSTSGLIESCFWQQCYDETSGYTYFWNTKTNEVTWESPQEYKEYLERVRQRETIDNTVPKIGATHSETLYVTNGEASTSSSGRVVTNGGASTSSSGRVVTNGGASTSSSGRVVTNGGASTSSSGRVVTNGGASTSSSGRIVTNGGASTSSSGRVVTNGGASTSSSGRVVTNGGASTSSSGRVLSNGEASTSSSGRVLSNGEASTSSSGRVLSNGEASTSSSGRVPTNGEASTSSSGRVPTNVEASTSSSGRVLTNVEASASSSGRVLTNGEASTSSSGRVLTNVEASASSSGRVLTNVEASASSSGRVLTNGEASTSSSGKILINGSGVKNSNKPLKKRTHNREEGKIEPITYFGPPTSDSSDDESNSRRKKLKLAEEEIKNNVSYGPYLPEGSSSPVSSPPINVSPPVTTNEVAVEEDTAETCPSSSSNKNSGNRAIRPECAMDLSRVLVTQSVVASENDANSPQIQVGNVSDSETHDSESALEVRGTLAEDSSKEASQPSTSSEGIRTSLEQHHTLCSHPSEDEPDSTCTSKLERCTKKTDENNLTQGLSFISQYEITDNESEGEVSEPSPLEIASNKQSPIEVADERNQAEQSSNSSEDLAQPTIDSEENSMNNFVSDSDSRVVPHGSPRVEVTPPRQEPRGSQEIEEMDLDEIEKELDRALERNACQSSSNVDSPAPSQRENAQPLPENENALPDLSEGSLELLSSDILGKLDLLTANRAQMPLLSTLLIMVDVRLTDWRKGALPSQYFLDRLREANDVLRQYETSAVPPGWTCNWDREERRYFYTHLETGRSQTDFPVETAAVNEAPGNSEEPRPRTITYKNILVGKHSSAGQHPVVTSSTAEGLFRSVAKNRARGSSKLPTVQSGEASCSFQQVQQTHVPTNQVEEEEAVPVPSSPIPPPRVQTPPPEVSSPSPRPPSSTPPPLPSPPKSPPPDSYPDSTEVEDNEPAVVYAQVDDAKAYEERLGYPSSSSHEIMVQAPTCPIPPLVPVGLPMVPTVANHNVLEQEQMAFYQSLGNSWMAQPTSMAGDDIPIPVQVPPSVVPPPPGVIIVRSPLSNGIEMPAYIAPPLQWPIMPPAPAEPFYYIPETNGALNLETNGLPQPELDETAIGIALAENHNDPLMALPAGPSSAGTSNETPNPPKKDKKKSKLATGLSLKKKNISSLVEKWQKIKKEQLREEEEVEGRKNSDQDGKISTTM